MTLFLLVPVLAGCAGNARVTSIVATDPGGRGTVAAVASPRVNGKEAPLEAVLPLVPSPLPRAGASCERGRGFVEIRFADGRRVRYGSCRPRSIDWLQLAVVGEARQWVAATTGRTRIAGATAAERRTLRSILAEMRPTTIRTVVVSRSRLRVEGGSSVRAQWEAALLGARYSALAERLGLRPVEFVLASGGGSSPGPPPAPPRLPAVRAAVARLRVDVREFREAAGAVAITLRPRVVAEFLRYRAPRFIRELHRAGAVGGLYVGIEDSAGAIVYAWGWLPTEGILYARPDLDSCGPISHSTPIFYRAPPCPLHRRRLVFGL